VTVTVVAEAVPAVTVFGLSEIDPGTGLFTAKEDDDEVPPPGVGLMAAIDSVPAAPRSAPVRVAVICVALV
jgi:hypothetical protein